MRMRVCIYCSWEQVQSVHSLQQKAAASHVAGTWQNLRSISFTCFSAALSSTEYRPVPYYSNRTKPLHCTAFSLASHGRILLSLAHTRPPFRSRPAGAESGIQRRRLADDSPGARHPLPRSRLCFPGALPLPSYHSLMRLTDTDNKQDRSVVLRTRYLADSAVQDRAGQSCSLSGSLPERPGAHQTAAPRAGESILHTDPHLTISRRTVCT